MESKDNAKLVDKSKKALTENHSNNNNKNERNQEEN